MSDQQNPTIAKLTAEQLDALDLYVQIEKLPNRAAAMKLVLDDMVKWAKKIRLQQAEETRRQQQEDEADGISY